MPSNTELVPVPFYDDVLYACRLEDGKIGVSIRRVCECLGLDLKTQHRKLTAAVWSCMVNMAIHDATGREQKLSVIPIDSLPMWMATISPRKVTLQVRDKIARFQLEARDVLARHFLPTPPTPPPPTIEPPAPASLMPSRFGGPLAFMRHTLEAMEGLAETQAQQAEQIDNHRNQLDHLWMGLAQTDDTIARTAERLQACPPEALHANQVAMRNEIDAIGQYLREMGEWLNARLADDEPAPPPQRMTVAAYARTRNVPMTSKDAAEIGRELAAECRSLGIPIETAPHATWGSVNTYPVGLLQRHFDRRLRHHDRRIAETN